MGRSRQRWHNPPLMVVGSPSTFLGRLRFVVLFRNMAGGYINAAFALPMLLGGKLTRRSQRQRRANDWLFSRFVAAEIYRA